VQKLFYGQLNERVTKQLPERQPGRGSVESIQRVPSQLACGSCLAALAKNIIYA